MFHGVESIQLAMRNTEEQAAKEESKELKNIQAFHKNAIMRGRQWLPQRELIMNLCTYYKSVKELQARPISRGGARWPGRDRNGLEPIDSSAHKRPSTAPGLSKRRTRQDAHQ